MTAARSILELVLQDAEGDALADRTITVTKPDGSALGVSIYDQVTGGSPVLAPVTNSLGTKRLYANFADLDAATVGRVKVAFSGISGDPVDAAFWPDPKDIFVDGATPNRTLGGTLGVTGLVTGSGGASFTRDADAYALTVQNLNTTTSRYLLVKNAENTNDVLWARRNSQGRDTVGIGIDDNIVDAVLDTRLFVYADTPVGAVGWVSIRSEADTSNTGGDYSTCSAIFRQLSGTSSFRALEGRVYRAGTSTSGGTWALELNTTTQIDGSDDLSQMVGAYIACGSPSLTASEVMGDTGVLIHGSRGWKFPIVCLAPNSTTRIWQVDENGLQQGGTVIPRTGATYTLGDGLTKNWLTVYSSIFSCMATGSESTPVYAFNPDTNTGLFNPAGDALAFTTGGTERGRITTTLWQHTIPMASTVAGSETAPVMTKSDDANTGLFFPAADNVGVTTGGTERWRFTGGGLIDFRDGTNQNFGAGGGGAAATLGKVGVAGAPGTAGQAGWIKCALGGTAIWFPYWIA